MVKTKQFNEALSFLDRGNLNENQTIKKNVDKNNDHRNTGNEMKGRQQFLRTIIESYESLCKSENS